MTVFLEAPDEQRHHLAVVHPHLVDVGVGTQTIEQDQAGRSGGEIGVQVIRRRAAPGEDEAVDPPLDQRSHGPQLTLRVLGGVGEQKRDPVLRHSMLDAVHHLGEGRLTGVRDDEADAVGPRPPEGPGERVLPVAGRIDGVEHASLSAGPDMPRPVDDVRDRRQRDACHPRNLNHRDHEDLLRR